MNDGGPAFPITLSDQAIIAVSKNPGGDFTSSDLSKIMRGMSLRDYFAAAALSGLPSYYSAPDSSMPTPDAIAHKAYELADAMISEREKGKDK